MRHSRPEELDVETDERLQETLLAPLCPRRVRRVRPQRLDNLDPPEFLARRA